MTTLSTQLSATLQSTSQLLDLLVPTLDTLNLLQDRQDLTNSHASSSLLQTPPELEISRRTFLKRQLGLVQKVLVETVWPDWEEALKAEDESGVIVEVVFERWFIPVLREDESDENSILRIDIVISAYATLTSLLSQKATLRPQSLSIITDLLRKLSQQYSIDKIHRGTFTLSAGEQEDERALAKAILRWELVLKDLYSLPTRVANAWGRLAEAQPSKYNLREVIPAELQWSEYHTALAAAYSRLLVQLSSNSSSTIAISASALSSPVLLFPPTFYSCPSSDPQSFFPVFLQSLLPTLLPPFPSPPEALLARKALLEVWSSVIEELGARDLHRLVTGTLQTLERHVLSKGEDEGRKLKGAVFILTSLFGALRSDRKELWESIVQTLVSRNSAWSRGMCQTLVMWARSEDKRGGEASVLQLMGLVFTVWGDQDSIVNGSEPSRLYHTALLLLLVLALPPLHPSVIKLSHSPPFLTAISAHLSLLRTLPRLLGMLVAEVISSRAMKIDGEVKPLSFGEVWDGEGEEKVRIKELRAFLMADNSKAGDWQEDLLSIFEKGAYVSVKSMKRPVAARSVPPVLTWPISVIPAPKSLITMIDPDDFQPFPLPPAPAESYLATLASSDPSLYASALPNTKPTSTRQRGKLRAPVYIPELVAYLRGKEIEGTEEKEDEQAERVEMGLKEGENLIRRKATWGGELSENSVDLAFAVIGLQDQFELEDFDKCRQRILVALVETCPTLVAPTLIEQYFSPHYTITQRNTILTSLVLGARALAGLPTLTPKQIATTPDIEAPLDLFPSKRLPPHLHQKLIGTKAPVENPKRGELEDLTDELTRIALSDAKTEAETSLPLAAKEKLLTVRRFASAPSPFAKSTSLAPTAPTFSTLASEYFVLPLINRFWLFLQDSASSLSTNSSPYAGGQSTPSLLEPILLTRFLSTLAILLHASRYSPYFLTVLVPESLELVLSLRVAQENSDANILSCEMELILGVLDSSVLIDGGRTIMNLRNGRGAEIVGECQDWAEQVFENEERKGGDGKGEGIGRVGRAAAGVLLRIEEILGKWRGSVGW